MSRYIVENAPFDAFILVNDVARNDSDENIENE